MKLLLDENVSPYVAVRLAKEDGVDACHIRERGLLGATDPEVLERAFAEDRVFVTKNVGDFEALARARDLHAGIVLIEDNDLTRDEQLEVLRTIVTELGSTDLVNRVVRITAAGTLTVKTIPPE